MYMKNITHLLSKTLWIFFIVCTVFAAHAQNWAPDRYLQGYEETTIKQPDDYSGKVVCTVVRRMSPCCSHVGILYVHGYNDYFFQKEEGDTFVDSCYNFYAVDLRKYGRSLQQGQTPYECRKISEYFPDIDSALNIMHNDGITRVILMGHSTGGLVVASYMNDKPSPLIKAVILNSPFLEWNMGGFTRKVGVPFMTWLGSWWPKLSISQGKSTAYAESLLKQYHGEWEYDTNLKTVEPRKVSAGWIRAITNAQKALKKHSDIKVPVLLMHSDKTVNAYKWSVDMERGDLVLNVEHISELGKKLGPDVTEDTIKDGLHDLALSAPEVRAKFYSDIFNWLDSIGLKPFK